jgi:Tfp pilus assembly protein PilN
MRQQINLYQTAARGQRMTLSAATLAVGLLATIAVLVAIWIYGSRQVATLEASLVTLRAQQQQLLDVATTADTARGERKRPQSLQVQVKQLQLELAQHQRALELLRDGAAGESGGFAARLAALAHQHMDGIWIDHLVLGGAAGVLSVSGVTRDADLVPRYLRGLAAEPALAGTRFDEFGIEGPKYVPTTTDATADATASNTAVKPTGIRFHATNSAATSKLPDGNS